MEEKEKIKSVTVVNETTELPMSSIQSYIRIINGVQVILDRDLAFLYGVETGNLNKAVKRNIDRFPEDFMFQLTKEDMNLIFQNGTSSWGGTRKLPYAFTESGIAMLSSVLRSKTAVEVNIRIMRAFTAMRQFLTANAIVFQRLESIEFHQLEMKHHQEETDKRLDEVFQRLDEGASIKDLGKKWFAFSKLEDVKPIDLINKINGII